MIDKVIIHSIDISLYQVSVLINGYEHIVTDSNGKLLRASNKMKLQVKFRNVRFKEMVLRHESAFDEMIGMESKPDSNMLEVPLGNTWLASPNDHHQA